MAAKKGALILIPLALVAAAVAVPKLRDRQARDPAAVRLSGNLEVTDAEVGFRIAGRVSERLVSEGERVTAGQVVGRLESQELEQEVALRRADAAVATAALAELEAGSRPEETAAAQAAVALAQAQLAELEAGTRVREIAAAEAALAGAVADERHAATELERARTLRDAGVATSQEFDRAQVEYDRTAARLAAVREHLALLKEGTRPEQIAQARARLEEASQRAELVRLGPRAETVAQARARLEQARAALALAETRLGYATLTAPLTGLVLTDHIEAGEFVAAGTPVVTVGDLEHPWLRAYIDEADLGRVKLGQSVEVTTDTYLGKVYGGTLTFIATEAEFTPRSVQTAKERVKLVYRVKIDVPNPEMDLKPGMPADARIRLGGGTEGVGGRTRAAPGTPPYSTGPGDRAQRTGAKEQEGGP
jgi:HlyD family secretion protein